jgi:hypothetical protein
VFDLVYVGAEKDFPDIKSSVPNRKKRKQGLSQEEKGCNQNPSKKRMVIGHIICRLKRYRIMSDVSRNKLRECNRVSDIVSGLVNYRTMYRHY